MVFGEIEGKWFNSILYYQKTCPNELFNALNNQAGRKNMKESRTNGASPLHSSQPGALSRRSSPSVSDEPEYDYVPMLGTLGTMKSFVIPTLAGARQLGEDDYDEDEDMMEGIRGGEEGDDDDGNDTGVYDDDENDLEYPLLPWEEEHERASVASTKKHKIKTKLKPTPKPKASKGLSAAASLFSAATTAKSTGTIKNKMVIKGIVPSAEKKQPGKKSIEEILFIQSLIAGSSSSFRPPSPNSPNFQTKMAQLMGEGENPKGTTWGVVVAAEETVMQDTEIMPEVAESSVGAVDVTADAAAALATMTPKRFKRIIHDEDEDEEVEENATEPVKKVAPVTKKRRVVLDEEEEEEKKEEEEAEEDEEEEENEEEEEEEEEEEVDEDADLDSEEEEEAFDDEVGSNHRRNDFKNQFIGSVVTTTNDEEDEDDIEEDDGENEDEEKGSTSNRNYNRCVKCKTSPAKLRSSNCNEKAFCASCFDNMIDIVDSNEKFICPCGVKHLVATVGS